MGKNWRGGASGGMVGRGGGRGGGGRGGRGGGSNNDISSCKGHGAIIGTCDAARERETSKEMVNLLNQIIESMSPPGDSANDELDATVSASASNGGGSQSIKDMLAQEIAEVRQQKSTATQNVMSVDTKVKGIVMIKVMRKDLCPVKLVKAIFERVRSEKAPCSRHVVRVIPLQKVFYTNNNQLSDNIGSIVKAAFPGCELQKFEKEIEKEAVKDAEKDQVESDEQIEDKTDYAGKKELIEAIEPANIIGENNELIIGEKRSIEDVTSEVEVSVEVDSKEEKQDTKRPCIEQPSSSSSSLSTTLELSAEPTSETTDIENTSERSTEIKEIAPSISYPPLNYSALYKARNHTIMTRETVQATIAKTVPTFFKPNFRKAKAIFIIEAMRNICGATLLEEGYEDYEEFNLKKFQNLHCKETLSSNLKEFKLIPKDVYEKDKALSYGPKTGADDIKNALKTKKDAEIINVDKIIDDMDTHQEINDDDVEDVDHDNKDSNDMKNEDQV